MHVLIEQSNAFIQRYPSCGKLIVVTIRHRAGIVIRIDRSLVFRRRRGIVQAQGRMFQVGFRIEYDENVRCCGRGFNVFESELWKR